MNSSSDFEDYPFLNREEFEEVCHLFDRLYCRAKLGPSRRKWKLEVVTVSDNSPYHFGLGSSTYVKIKRPLDSDADDGMLSSEFGRLELDEARDSSEAALNMNDLEMLDAEAADTCTGPDYLALQEAILRHRQDVPVAHVVYEIHLHPTYRAPCLWFSLHGLPESEPALSFDTVFGRLVPANFRHGLQNAGPIGGLSIDNNPVTGVPCFFVHPCLLGEAMANFHCSKENYLMVWMGLVGGSVGLWVPKQMALEQGRA